MADGNDYLNGFRFEAVAPPPPMTLEEMTTLLARFEVSKKRIACASDVFEQVRNAVYNSGAGAYYTVLECSWMDDGQVVMMQSEAEIEADLQAAGLRMMDEAIERLGREQLVWDLNSAVVYRSGPRSWIAPGF